MPPLSLTQVNFVNSFFYPNIIFINLITYIYLILKSPKQPMTNFELSLKNPLWYALKETHNTFLLTYNGVNFYHPNICPFGAFQDTTKTAKALNAYSKLTDSFYLVSENDTPTFDDTVVILDRKIECVQMGLHLFKPFNITDTIVPLTNKHSDEVYNLVWLVMPGYFKKQTFNMGKYFGIYKDDKLVAVTGQRMQTNHFIEVSAVVTHPDYTKRGLAKQLVTHTTKDILKTGKQVILHTTKGNPAIKIYEQLGFQITRDMNWWFFKKK